MVLFRPQLGKRFPLPLLKFSQFDPFDLFWQYSSPNNLLRQPDPRYVGQGYYKPQVSHIGSYSQVTLDHTHKGNMPKTKKIRITMVIKLSIFFANVTLRPMIRTLSNIVPLTV